MKELLILLVLIIKLTLVGFTIYFGYQFLNTENMFDLTRHGILTIIFMLLAGNSSTTIEVNSK